MKFDVRDEYNLKQFMPNKNSLKAMTDFFYAFSDSTRLKIIMLLSIKPLCVGEMVNILDLNQTTLSHQLKILKSHNLLSCDRIGKKIIYYIKNNQIEQVLNATVDCV